MKNINPRSTTLIALNYMRMYVFFLKERAATLLDRFYGVWSNTKLNPPNDHKEYGHRANVLQNEWMNTTNFDQLIRIPKYVGNTNVIRVCNQYHLNS